MMRMKRRESKMPLTMILALFFGLLSASSASADPFHPRSGWTCSGSTSPHTSFTADVLFRSNQGGQARYQLRVLASAEGSPPKLTLLDQVSEDQSAQAYTYSGSRDGATFELTIRKVEGSDQGLPATLKSSLLPSEVPMLCNRTR